MEKLFLRQNPVSIGFDLNGEKKNLAYQRYLSVKNFLSENQDLGGLEILDAVVQNGKEYIVSVVNLEARIKNLKAEHGETSLKYQDLTYSLEVDRTEKHNSFLSTLKALNIYLQREYEQTKELIPNTRIFSEDSSNINDRRVVSNWAWFLVSGVYEIVHTRN